VLVLVLVKPKGWGASGRQLKTCMFHVDHVSRGRIFVWIFWSGGEMDIFRKYAGGNLEKSRKDLGNDPGNSGKQRGQIA
jgi:hypothetical protein